MRIRRSASKLLGLAASTKPASPPRWSSSELAASAAAGMLCQLNCSPWDAMPNLQLAMFFQDEEEGEGRGVPEHGFEVKEEEYEDLTSAALLPAHSESNLEDAKTLKKKKQKKVSKGKGKNQVERGSRGVDGAVACKKTDGKGWHCKRPAHHPHSLCQYHLAQLRNYGGSQSNGASTELTSQGKQTTRSRKKSNTSAAADPNFDYYYYSGFGPWRGKTRGGNSASREGVVEAENGSGSGSGSSKSSECTDVNEDCDAPVAGEDECALDDEEDYDGEASADVSYVEDNGEGQVKRKVKKRGRKPVKARSLKSLL